LLRRQRTATAHAHPGDRRCSGASVPDGRAKRPTSWVNVGLMFRRLSLV
jgi:hypothetical protein